ncbi:hypothetical protein J9317_12365 [Metabacillus sp. KIGAM252]|uniref:Methylmalonyl-CoA mutase alpha/beta chain catalytic domain-containing protein n=1 Tax=Metabacillus flavus TaxID=2823519 RepID=A0ABS5LGR6_9BACI|nr:methylmalonyl-CoA mutase family protein [Metabacillus flavus]MBS2969559.1 hypothetical protein [Metabacillus flavus]
MNKGQKTQEAFQDSTEQAWLEAVSKALKGKSADSLRTVSNENIILKPLYLKKDSVQVPEPGAAPYIRGTEKIKTMWKTAQSVNHCESIDHLVSALDSADEKGLNSFYLSSMRTILDQDNFQKLINLLKSSKLHFMIDFEEAPELMAFFAAEMKAFGAGTAGCDPYEAVMNGNLEDLDHALCWMMDYTEAAGGKKNQKTILFKGDLLHNSGANAVQELAYTFAKAIDFLNWCRQNGKSAELAAGKSAFSFSSGSQFFMETAKLRAARLLWSSIVSAFGGDLEAQKLYSHVKTSSFNKSRLDVHVNLLRTSTEAFSAVLGNADAITILPFDEVNGGSILSERAARNIHYLLSEESLLGKVNDPSGGSWYIESLTQELAKAAWDKILEIEENGGFLKVLRKGDIQAELSAGYQAQAESLNTQKKMMIGVNYYANPEDRIAAAEKHIHISLWPKESFSESRSKLDEGKKLSYETLNRKTGLIQSRRLAEPFEKLRMDAFEYTKRAGKAPYVQIAVLGSLKQFKPRLDFLMGLLASGGIEGSITPLAEADLNKTTFLCGNDQSYKEYKNEIFSFIKNANGEIYIVGKQPAEWEERLSVQNEAVLGMNRLAFLEELQNVLGVKN